MKCPKCDGVGEGMFPIYIKGSPYQPNYWEYRRCERCHGTGEVTLTNEEWLRQASTEELADILGDIAVSDVLYDKMRRPYYTDGKQAVMEWLQEKHHE